MHSLNYVSTVVEHTSDVFGVDRTRKVRITVVLPITAGRTYALNKHNNQYNTHTGTVTVLEDAIHTRNSSLIKYLALTKSGSSPGSKTAKYDKRTKLILYYIENID